MKLATLAFLILFSVPALAGEGKIFTAYNMWHGNLDNISCLNYQVGTLIPAGTEIKKLIVQKESFDVSKSTWLEPKIKLEMIDGKKYEINFNPKYHPGLDIDSFAKRVYTTKTIEEIQQEFDPSEIEAISRGAVIRGMNKSAVLVSYGYPPEHYTPSLKSNKWRFWVNRFKSKNICFGEKEEAIACEELKSNDL